LHKQGRKDVVQKFTKKKIHQSLTTTDFKTAVTVYKEGTQNVDCIIQCVNQDVDYKSYVSETTTSKFLPQIIEKKKKLMKSDKTRDKRLRSMHFVIKLKHINKLNEFLALMIRK